jgi:asparagine synthase (glutamine-hydrolysing)
MCGIAGIVRLEAGSTRGEAVSPDLIRAMTTALAHRGPDAEGYYHGEGVALGHRRLKVVDLVGGAQPMSNPEGTVWVTYNGEIYNHRDLRVDLEARGHVFRSVCDTEVLVHGYTEWGVAGLLERIDGMFAFGVWDTEARRLTLARDRMGQKPLFYTVTPRGDLLFSSELKALLAHPDVEPSVDEEGLAAYVTSEYLPGELSMIDGVRKLLPATWLTFENGEVQRRSYWQMPVMDLPAPRHASDRFIELFDSAVGRRLMADVPLGVFLSGGIDSSSVAASVVHQRTAADVKTFSIGFREESYDESSIARRVAQHLGTDHHERVFTAEAMKDVLPEVIATLDEPFGDASLLPTYLLSRFARERVTVALGGDGGDELLLGYPTFLAESVANVYSRLPAPIRNGAKRLGRALPVSTRNMSFDFKVNAFLRAADAPRPWRHPLWLGSAIPGDSDDPLHPELREKYSTARVLAYAASEYNLPSTRSDLQRLSYQYCRTYLADDILHKIDRASMAVSLEARSPFMGRALVEFVAALPSSQKLSRLGRGKVILKDAMRGRLPREVIDRPKKGFGIPVAAWLKGPLREVMNDLLSESRTRTSGYFDSARVRQLINEHCEGTRNHRKVLWTLLSFELWREARGIRGRA